MRTPSTAGRVRRRPGAKAVVLVVTLVAATLGTTGCGPSRDESHARATGTLPTTPATNGSSAADLPAYETVWSPVAAKIAPSVSNRYGSRSAAAATAVAVDVVERLAFDHASMSATLPDQRGRVLSVTGVMTEDAAADWRRAVTAYSTGTERARKRQGNLVMSLSLYAAWSHDDTPTNGGGMRVNPDGPAAVNPRLKSVRASLESDGRVAVNVTSAADVRLIVRNKPRLMRIDRKQEFWMQRVGGTWKVDGWNGSLTAGQYRPDN